MLCCKGWEVFMKVGRGERRILTGMVLGAAQAAALCVGCSDASEPSRRGSDPFGAGTGTSTDGTGNYPGAVGDPGDPGYGDPGQTPGSTTQPTGTPLPCDVYAAVVNNCQSCHGPTPIGGAPMPLVTHEDFTRVVTAATTEAVRGQTFPAHELVRMRLNDPGAPMPPGGDISEADRAVLDNWLAAGAPPGGEGDRTCGGTAPGGEPGDPIGGGQPALGSECDAAGAFEPLVPRPGETCYELPLHGGQTPGDTSPYIIPAGEHYQQFYYRVPWPTGVQATRFGARFDNLQVLHHWLLFSSARSLLADGTSETVIGTQIGDSAELLGGWAVGGCNVELPPDVGLELPPADTILNVQWHFYNNTGAPVADTSAVQVCTVPAGTRPHVGSLTWLGTELLGLGPLGMPPGENDYGGTCRNNTNGPITIWAFWPHMHALGRNMRSVVRRTDGTMEEVFNRPFDFNHQVHYDVDPKVVLHPGDEIISTCTFMNDRGVHVPFGPSSDQEMCYQFTFAYPARALNNGVPSLIGATNTCW